MLSKIPRGRFVKVEEIAAMVAWLVSEENSFTTGGGLRPERRSRDLLTRTCRQLTPPEGVRRPRRHVL